MANNVAINGAVSGDWVVWENEHAANRTVNSGSNEVVNTFLHHIRERGTHATEVMLNQLGTMPADHHAYKCPKVTSYAAYNTMAMLRGHLEEAKKLYAAEERRKEELARRQKLAADTVDHATKEAVRKAKNAKRNAKKRAAKRRIKCEKMKTEMNEKLELAELLRSQSTDLMKKGMQHTVEGRKRMLKWANEATQLTLEAAALSEKVLAATNAEVARALPHMKSIVASPEPEFVADNGSDLSDCESSKCLACQDSGIAYLSDGVHGPCLECDVYTEPEEGAESLAFDGDAINSLASAGIQTHGARFNRGNGGLTVPVTVHGGSSGSSRSAKRNALKKLKKRLGDMSS
tara:strand:+ start:2959 stop:3999 length:1041 start_codon:yes stop_codon:yes gene_type:complete